MTAHFEIVQTDSEQPWHVRVVGSNGEPVLAGEPLSGVNDALKAVLAVASLFYPDAALDIRGLTDREWFIGVNGAATGPQVLYVDERDPQHEVPD